MAEVLRALSRPSTRGKIPPQRADLTHCNAGWLATVDAGTALAPIYLAHDEGIALHVWVDETRPAQPGPAHGLGTGTHGVPHTSSPTTPAVI